jgi:hypothetical protein
MLLKGRTAAQEVQQEAQYNNHLRELPPKSKVVKYTDEAFVQVAIEWLAVTDQV